jgi:hypothetical protein
MARRQKPKPPIHDETIGLAIAKAVSDGDIVMFRQIFAPISPLRAWTPENVYTPKYAYMLPEEEEEGSRLFQEALELARQPDVAAHVREQLEEDRPAQLHAALLLQLADNAVRHAKYTSAAQAYELLRMRPRMREEFLRQADAALDAGDTPRAVRGYTVGAALEYNYAAFPEPLPAVPDYQSRALLLHADYPAGPENCVALRQPAAFLKTALTYLLVDKEAAARLEDRPAEQVAGFLTEWVRQRDPEWDTFAQRYREACSLVSEFGRRLQRQANRDEGVTEELEVEIEEQQEARDPALISATLLGRPIERGAWWQYLKELAFAHPAAALFVARQAVSSDLEIIMPRFREDCPLIGPLGLAEPRAAHA